MRPDTMVVASWTKYEMVQSIGAGSYGQVFLVRGRSQAGGQEGTHVVKRVHVADLADDELKGAVNEVQVLSLLDHCNVVAYRDHYVDDEGFLNIVMEYCAQGDLSKLIEARKEAKQPFKQDEIAYWGFQLMQGVKYIHNIGIIHRDLKPANIFLTNNSILKLADFGISKLVSATTVAQTVIGTLFYIAPEICENQEYTSKADVWSCGCVLYELAALEKAFYGANILAVVKKVTDGQYTPLGKRYAKLARMVEKMLVVDPAKRYSIAELTDEFYLRLGAALPAPEVEGLSAVDVEHRYAEWWELCQSRQRLGKPASSKKLPRSPSGGSCANGGTPKSTGGGGGGGGKPSKTRATRAPSEFDISNGNGGNAPSKPPRACKTTCCRIPDLVVPSGEELALSFGSHRSSRLSEHEHTLPVAREGVSGTDARAPAPTDINREREEVLNLTGGTKARQRYQCMLLDESIAGAPDARPVARSGGRRPANTQRDGGGHGTSGSGNGVATTSPTPPPPPGQKRKGRRGHGGGGEKSKRATTPQSRGSTPRGEGAAVPKRKTSSRASTPSSKKQGKPTTRARARRGQGAGVGLPAGGVGGRGHASSSDSGDGGYSMDEFEDPCYSDESFERYSEDGDASDPDATVKTVAKDLCISDSEWVSIRRAIEIDYDTDRQATLVRRKQREIKKR